MTVAPIHHKWGMQLLERPGYADWMESQVEREDVPELLKQVVREQHVSMKDVPYGLLFYEGHPNDDSIALRRSATCELLDGGVYRHYLFPMGTSLDQVFFPDFRAHLSQLGIFFCWKETAAQRNLTFTPWDVSKLEKQSRMARLFWSNPGGDWLAGFTDSNVQVLGHLKRAIAKPEATARALLSEHVCPEWLWTDDISLRLMHPKRRESTFRHPWLWAESDAISESELRDLRTIAAMRIRLLRVLQWPVAATSILDFVHHLSEFDLAYIKANYPELLAEIAEWQRDLSPMYPVLFSKEFTSRYDRYRS